MVSCDPQVMKSIRFHLSYCGSCRQELEVWETMQADLRGMPRLQVPPELALRIACWKCRRACIRKWFAWLRVWMDNVLQPMLLPASGGVLAAIVCFCLIMGSLVVPVSEDSGCAPGLSDAAPRFASWRRLISTPATRRCRGGRPDRRGWPRDGVSRVIGREFPGAHPATGPGDLLQ